MALTFQELLKEVKSLKGRKSQLPWHLQQELFSRGAGNAAIGTAKELGIIMTALGKSSDKALELLRHHQQMLLSAMAGRVPYSCCMTCVSAASRRMRSPTTA